MMYNIQKHLQFILVQYANLMSKLFMEWNNVGLQNEYAKLVLANYFTFFSKLRI